MPDERWLSIEVENEDEVIHDLNIYHELARHRMKGLLDELAHDGVRILEKNVPNYTSYTLRHVDRTGVEWQSGGAGGGGEYEATVGIKAGTSYHPVYANQGTGEFGPYLKSPYLAHNPSGRMWFYSEKYGRVIGVESVRGQKAQNYLYTTFRELQVFAHARMTLGSF
jgi:hypothetical protein